MTYRVSSLLLFLIISWVIGCSGKSGTSSQGSYLEKGTYKFNMYDSLNVKIAEGTLTVEIYKDNKISGTYNFTNVITEFRGYGSMKGSFEGKVNDKEKMALINTNPGKADNNVFFNVEIKDNILEGMWYHSAFRNESTPNKITLTKK